MFTSNHLTSKNKREPFGNSQKHQGMRVHFQRANTTYRSASPMPLHQNRAAPLIMICFQRVSIDPCGSAFKQQSSHLRSTSLIPTGEHRATHSQKPSNIRPPPDTDSHLQSSSCRLAPCASAEPGRVQTATSSITPPDTDSDVESFCRHATRCTPHSPAISIQHR